MNATIQSDAEVETCYCARCATHTAHARIHPNPSRTDIYRLRCLRCGELARKLYTTLVQMDLFGSDTDELEREVRQNPQAYPDLVFE